MYRNNTHIAIRGAMYEATFGMRMLENVNTIYRIAREMAPSSPCVEVA